MTKDQLAYDFIPDSKIVCTQGGDIGTKQGSGERKTLDGIELFHVAEPKGKACGLESQNKVHSSLPLCVPRIQIQPHPPSDVREA